jgi:uncharacterized protein (TIGR03067 family)
LFLVLAIGLGADADEAAKKEYARFEGVWSFALVEVEGAKQPDVPFERNKIIISRDGNFIVMQGQRITRGQFRVDLSKMPKHFDVTITAGPNKGHVLPAIYELEGDTYKVCSSLVSKERPSAFASKPGSGTLLQVLKREKQAVKDALVEVARQELAGSWQAVSYSLDGEKASDEDMKKIKLTIDLRGKTAALRDGTVFIASTTTVDPSARPMTIDMAYTEGDLTGKTALGIYKIEPDLLTICRSAPGKSRPTEFASKPGSGHTLMTYMREKPSPR